MTSEEQEKANVIWRLVKQQGEDERYKNFSHNEIDEMVLAKNLDPRLQELWDKRESLLVDDFKEKCNVTDEYFRPWCVLCQFHFKLVIY